MKFELTQAQYDTLSEIIGNYQENCRHGVFNYQKYALETEDPVIKQQYARLAAEETARLGKATALGEYLESAAGFNQNG